MSPAHFGLPMTMASTRFAAFLAGLAIAGPGSSILRARGRANLIGSSGRSAAGPKAAYELALQLDGYMGAGEN